MKRIYPVMLSLLLLYFSFYYTSKVVDIIRSKDPIMMKIKKEKNKYEENGKNAIVKDNRVTPGKNKKVVNEKESFMKMKKYGTYNDSLYVFDEEKPNKKVDDYFDKYIESGRTDSNEVALLFQIKRFEDINKIIETIKMNDIKATFFLDGLYIENNRSETNYLKEQGHELELLSYNDTLERENFIEGLHALFNITNISPKYCYSEYDNKSVLELCNSLSMHTIIPTIMANNNSFSIIKNKLKSGSIISLGNSDKNLNTIINYIKQRGYKLVTLEELLSESLEK